MPYPEYEADVLRTLSLQFNLQDEDSGPSPTPAELRDVLQRAADLGQEVDVFKRAIFYGSTFKREEDGVAHEAVDLHRGDNSPDSRYPSPDMIHSAMGIFTEAAEFLEAVIASTFEGEPFDHVNAIEELGDLEWYMAVMRDRLDVSQEDVQRRNIAKLRARYPEKFESSDALNRDLGRERDALQG